MGLTVPAVHYSALASLPPDFASSISQHTPSLRLKLNQIFKKLLNHDLHHEQTMATETIEEKENGQSVVLNNPNNNNSDERTFLTQTSTKSLNEPSERLPFTEPYLTTPKIEQPPFESSLYHKHCLRQEKFIDQKRQHPEPSYVKNTRTNFKNNPYTKSRAEQYSMKFNKNSTTVLSELPSIEDRIGLQYATQRNNPTPNHPIRSSYTQHLRRLQSKSKVRPMATNETKPPSPISSSIAHRIELLKQAMNNHQLEIHSSKASSIEPNSSPVFESTHKQTQTTNSPLKSSEVHHIHHHHIYSSSFLSIPWRTYLSILGTMTMIFFLLFQFITIN